MLATATSAQEQTDLTRAASEEKEILRTIPGAETVPPEMAELVELVGDNQRPLNVYAGLDYVSQYIARGLVFVDEPSLQPWAEVDVSLSRDVDTNGPLGGMSFFAGNWNNINLASGSDGIARSGSAADLKDWYETDIYAGLRLSLHENLLVSFRYNYYTSPSDSFADIGELDFRIAWDDSSFWGDRVELTGFRLTPRVRIAKELDDGGGPEQWFFSPRLTPSFVLDGLPNDPRINFPLILGLGADGQYIDSTTGEDETFGFFQTGVAVDLPLDVLPSEGGALSVTGAVDVYILADENLSPNQDRTEVVARFGVSYSF